MKKYYISMTDGESGICKYSRDFYQLVLKQRDYIFVDSRTDAIDVLSLITSRDHVHFEIGIFQRAEIHLLLTMLRANYRNIAVTLHDAPLLKYPVSDFGNPILNNLSKFADIHLTRFRLAARYMNKINTVYVLSQKGVDLVKRTYDIDNVFHLPHVIDVGEIRQSPGLQRNFVYLGFIGRNKSIEYALKLHRELLKVDPNIHFYLIGKALGDQERYRSKLEEKYNGNVHFMGYLPEDRVDEIFQNASFSLQPFRSYRFFAPFSGSILYNLKKGNIVFTSAVNTIPEVIDHGKNGFHLSGNLSGDSKMIGTILDNEPAIRAVRERAYTYLMENHTAEVAGRALRDEPVIFSGIP